LNLENHNNVDMIIAVEWPQELDFENIDDIENHVVEYKQISLHESQTAKIISDQIRINSLIEELMETLD